MSWEEHLHRAGHSAGQEDDGHLCQKGNCLWDPDLISTTGVLRAVLGRKIEGGPPALRHFITFESSAGFQHNDDQQALEFAKCF